MTDLCADCEHMRRDNEFSMRCYSPQLVKMRVAGILCTFERDGHREPDRCIEAGTGKCGPTALNMQRRTGV